MHHRATQRKQRKPLSRPFLGAVQNIQHDHARFNGPIRGNVMGGPLYSSGTFRRSSRLRTSSLDKISARSAAAMLLFSFRLYQWL